jgi:serine/threonine protein kinase
MQCTFCDTPVSDGAVYCHQCGSLVSDAEGQAAVTRTLNDSGIRHLTELLRQDAEDEFEVGRQLGRGGMAVVFLAKEVKLDRQVAIKVLPPELTFGHGVDRFMREAKTAAKLDHPNIIPIYRISDGGKIFWYAMKFLEGQSLDQRLADTGPMAVADVIELLMPVADALDYAHDQQVVHRDIKPANIMVDSRNRVMVTDFGIAKALTEGTLTASGSVIGTPYFMSPEQGMGKAVTGASDQYSVAVMAYRMLSGHLPFEGDSAIDILHKHCTAQPLPLKELRPGLPNHLYQAVNKALAKKPEHRFSSVTAFVNALKEPSDEATLADVETVSMDTPQSEHDRISTELMARFSKPGTKQDQAGVAQPPKKKRRAAILVGFAIAVAVGGLGSLWFTRQTEMDAEARASEAPAPESTAAAQSDPMDTTSVQSQDVVPARAEEAVAEPTTPTTAQLTFTGVPSSQLAPTPFA